MKTVLFSVRYLSIRIRMRMISIHLLYRLHQSQQERPERQEPVEVEAPEEEMRPLVPLREVRSQSRFVLKYVDWCIFSRHVVKRSTRETSG